MDSKLQQEREVNGGTPFAEARGSAHPSGGPEVWNVVAWGNVRECRTTESVIEEVRQALELGCRTISIERQGAPNTVLGHTGAKPNPTNELDSKA